MNKFRVKQTTALIEHECTRHELTFGWQERERFAGLNEGSEIGQRAHDRCDNGHQTFPSSFVARFLSSVGCTGGIGKVGFTGEVAC